MFRVSSVLAALGAAAFLASLLWMGRLEAAGPAHADVALPGGMPATFYVPQRDRQRGRLPAPPPRAERPPAVVLAHGITLDRATVSSLARRLAANGYAVLAPDLRGHGANGNPFARHAQEEGNAADVATAVDWLRASAYADGARVAVMGHSMGARAVLRFAELDTGIDAAVLLSGGRHLFGPYRPPNALFLVAEGDPARTHRAAEELAARLAGVEEAKPGRRYGSFERGDAVRILEIPGANHGTILWSERTVSEALAWLDAAFGITRGGAPELGDPRLRALVPALLALPLVLLGVGLVLGGLAPPWPADEEGGGWGLALLALALLGALPFAGLAPLAFFLGLEAGDRMIGHLALTGAALLAGLALAGRPLAPAPGAGRSVLAGLVAAAGVYAALVPLGGVVHHLEPTGERALTALLAALLLLPFFLAFETALRRGPSGRALSRAVAGRILVVAVVLLAALLEVLPSFAVFLIAPLALFFAILELVAAVAYARSRNRLAIATFESLTLAWLLAVLLPLR